jgi:transcription antitermination factor NusG
MIGWKMSPLSKSIKGAVSALSISSICATRSAEPAACITTAVSHEAFILHDDPSREWVVLHTKSRREKKVAERCLQLGIRHYLPLRKSVTGRRGRRHIADMPLFSGYIFCYLNGPERWRLLQTGHIANTLHVPDQQQLLDDLRNIQQAIEQGAYLEPTSIVKRGQRVRIVDGPLTGLEGLVRRCAGRYRLVLNMDCLQQAVDCEIDVRMVNPL